MRPLFLLIVCLSLVCGACVPEGASASPRKSAPKKSVSAELAPDESFTRLRADRPAVLFEERRGVRSIQYVSVEVKNVGEHVAQHVEILAVPTVGPSYPLRGPKKLNRGQRAVYAARVKLPVPSAASVRIVARCGTCRR